MYNEELRRNLIVRFICKFTRFVSVVIKLFDSKKIDESRTHFAIIRELAINPKRTSLVCSASNVIRITLQK